jgi:hypothetical protein
MEIPVPWTGDEVRRRRLALDLSQQTAADLCNRTQPWLAQIEGLGGADLSVAQEQAVSPLMFRARHSATRTVESAGRSDICVEPGCRNARMKKGPGERGAPYKFCRKHRIGGW